MTYRRAKRLSLELLPLVLLIVVPLSVHAGVFTSIVSLIHEPPEEESVVTYTHDAQTIPLLKAAQHPDPDSSQGGGDVIINDGALVPGGEITDESDTINTKTANGEISVYVVREGDTLSQIAEMYDVSANTILWANDIKKAGLIQPGTELVILPITGVRHVVKEGETLSDIVEKYEGDLDEVISYNQLASADAITPGDTVVVPGGAVEQTVRERSAPTPTKTSGSVAVATGGGSNGYSHPLPGGQRTQGIHGYNGVDYAAPVGTPIYAAAAGEVIISKGSGWNGGYGSYVVIRHPNGTQTLYAHNSSNAVGVGQYVAAGETVAYVGSTGRSTGAHLHFEVRGASNPF